MIINNKKKDENKQRGNYGRISSRVYQVPSQDYYLYNKYTEADKKLFKQIDENKDWGLAFGGKKSKRKTRSKRQSGGAKTRSGKDTSKAFKVSKTIKKNKPKKPSPSPKKESN